MFGLIPLFLEGSVWQSVHAPGLAVTLLGQVAASSQVSASGQLAASCSRRELSHQTLPWHLCLGHPSLPRLRSMHSRLLVPSLFWSVPYLPRSPAPPCLPCVEGRQRAAPLSSDFPPTTAPMQTLRMDLRERFRPDFPVLRLHSDRGIEFSSDLLVEFYRDEGIHQSFMFPASHQQNGIAKCRIGLILEGPAPSAEGGDHAADDMSATRRSPRLETPPRFPPRPSSPTPQPAAVDSSAENANSVPGGAEIEGEGSGGAAPEVAAIGITSTGGAGSWGAAIGGADSRGTAGADSRGTAGAGGTGGTAGCAGGAAGAGGTSGAAGAGGAKATSPRGAAGVGGATRAVSPTVTRLLANVVTDPDLESTAAFALVTELVDFAARSRLDYVASLVPESEYFCPPSVGG
ncbi:unnamed protein product [Closterium sp. NIES-54]